jgi:hypothetical protein
MVSVSIKFEDLLTPFNKEPSVTPVAAKITSDITISSLE